MLDIFTATGAGLEVFSAPDIYATIPAKGGTLRLAPGRYAVHETAPLAGSALEGVKIRYGDGKLGWVAKLAGKYALCGMTLAEAETAGLVGAAGAKAGWDLPAAREAMQKAVDTCRTAAEAAENALTKLEE